MIIYEVIYIIAISLQLAGALVLIRSFGKLKLTESTKVASVENEPNMHWSRLEDGGIETVTYSAEELQKTAINVLQNRFAFCFIAIGYLLGIFGEVGNKCWDAIAVIAMAFILFILCRFATKAYAKHRFNKDEKVVVNKHELK